MTALPFAGVTVAPRLADRLRLSLGADVAISAPRADVAFAGRVATSWARPLGLFSAGVSFDF